MGKSKNKAAFLALIGGTFGIHKFYLNDPGTGIFYIAITLMASSFFPVATLLGVIDAVRLFAMSTKQFDARYNNRPGMRRAVRKNQRTNTQTRQQRDVEMERQKYVYKKTKTKVRNNPFLKSANKKFKEYDLEGALEDYNKAEEISPADKQVHFNLACIYSLMETPSKSLFHLAEAVKLGYKDLEKIDTVDELAFLRIQPQFTTFKQNGYTLSAKPSAIEPPEGDLLQNDALLSQLNKLKELRERGLLSEREFVYEKDKLMRR